MVSVLVVISRTNYYVIGSFPFVVAICWYLFSYAVRAYKESMRIETITKSPLLNFINESFTGASTIRAFRKEGAFIEKTYEILDKNILAN
jgi:ABC-type bacteriocin/lantibiotic exporter with double-glycine peptidase domain